MTYENLQYKINQFKGLKFMNFIFCFSYLKEVIRNIFPIPSDWFEMEEANSFNVKQVLWSSGFCRPVLEVTYFYGKWKKNMEDVDLNNSENLKLFFFEKHYKPFFS